MSQKLQPVRGTHDILPTDALKRRFIAETAREVGMLYGYEELATPVFEFTKVFSRSLGETSDVVTKEMYTFTDRGGDMITLRPEFTAGVVRALISNGLTQQLPARFFSTGPLFRYERPQKGRMRQFHQFNFELLGQAEPETDVEVLALAQHILTELGLKDDVILELNSLGDEESRRRYRDELVNYFTRYQNDLSEDSRHRLEKNPLRILDSKDENDRKLVAGAPQVEEAFTEEATAFFATVREGLERLGIAYKINPRLVRGLDYYNHTVFEFTTDKLGAQNAVLSGGRYDGLVAMLGGPAIPGIGFAAGIERLAELVEKTLAIPRPVAIVPLDEAYVLDALEIAQTLRRQGIRAELIRGGNVGKRMKKADKMNAKAAIILGEEELATSKVMLKDLGSGEQKPVPLNDLVRELKE